MSAFICDKQHFIDLAWWAASSARRYGEPRYVPAESSGLGLYGQDAAQAIAVALYAANVRGVEARYGEVDGEAATLAPVVPKRAPASSRMSAVEAIKALRCIAYQAENAEDWPTSAGHDLVEALTMRALRELPGYGEAPWERHGQVNAVGA